MLKRIGRPGIKHVVLATLRNLSTELVEWIKCIHYRQATDIRVMTLDGYCMFIYRAPIVPQVGDAIFIPGSDAMMLPMDVIVRHVRHAVARITLESGATDERLSQYEVYVEITKKYETPVDRGFIAETHRWTHDDITLIQK